MQIKKILTGFVASALSVTMFLGATVPALAATTPGLPVPGDNGYGSLHQYISPTKEKDVYKVTLSLAGRGEDPMRTEVAIVIDNSSSMNQTGSDSLGAISFDSVSINGNAVGMLLPTDQPNYAGFPDQAAAQAVDGLHNPPGLSPSDQTVWYYPLTGKLDTLISASVPTAVTDASPGPRDTRLAAALQGGQAAVEKFLDPDTNFAYERTYMGAATFSGDTDSSMETPYSDPWGTLPHGMSITSLHGAPFSTYGYGNSTIRAFASALNWSSRSGWTNTVADVINSNPAGTLDTQKVVDRAYGADPNSLPEQIRSRANGDPDPIVETAAQNGMVGYWNGTGAGYLQKELENIAASTGNVTTDIMTGLQEASNFFWGTSTPVPLTVGTGAGNFDEKTGFELWADPDLNGKIVPLRRFVIFLSDLADTGFGGRSDLDIAESFNLVDGLKAAGVEFMVVGVDTVNADSGHQNDLGEIKFDTASGAGAVDVTVPGKNQTKFPWPDDSWGQYGIYMGMKLQHSKYTTAGNGTWPALQAIYGKEAGPGASATTANTNWTGETPNYIYVPGGNNAGDAIRAAIEEYVDRIIFDGTDAMADIKINSNFNIYNMPGEPRYVVTGTNGQAVSINGEKIHWDMNGGIPRSQVPNTLSFYVKVDENHNVEDGQFAAVLETAEFSVKGAFSDSTGATPGFNGHFPIRTVKKDWVEAFVSPSGEIKQDSTAADVEPVVVVDSSKNKSGGLLPILGSMSGRSNEKIVVKSIKSSVRKDGRTQVQVTISSSSDAFPLFQWQYKKSDGSWADVYGANSSIFVIGKSFKAGNLYEFRCVIDNGSGLKTISDIIKVKVTAAKK